MIAKFYRIFWKIWKVFSKPFFENERIDLVRYEKRDLDEVTD